MIETLSPSLIKEALERKAWKSRLNILNLSVFDKLIEIQRENHELIEIPFEMLEAKMLIPKVDLWAAITHLSQENNWIELLYRNDKEVIKLTERGEEVIKNESDNRVEFHNELERKVSEKLPNFGDKKIAVNALYESFITSWKRMPGRPKGNVNLKNTTEKTYSSPDQLVVAIREGKEEDKVLIAFGLAVLQNWLVQKTKGQMNHNLNTNRTQNIILDTNILYALLMPYHSFHKLSQHILNSLLQLKQQNITTIPLLSIYTFRELQDILEAVRQTTLSISGIPGITYDLIYKRIDSFFRELQDSFFRECAELMAQGGWGSFERYQGLIQKRLLALGEKQGLRQIEKRYEIKAENHESRDKYIGEIKDILLSIPRDEKGYQETLHIKNIERKAIHKAHLFLLANECLEGDCLIWTLHRNLRNIEKQLSHNWKCVSWRFQVLENVGNISIVINPEDIPYVAQGFVDSIPAEIDEVTRNGLQKVRAIITSEAANKVFSDEVQRIMQGGTDKLIDKYLKILSDVIYEKSTVTEENISDEGM